ncbi:hypothetical protein HYR99_27335, partial [Candidatus Poribacteria bacterium]|nr:hypothetical protein [Candidatus Poribacteria bacterium]
MGGERENEATNQPAYVGFDTLRYSTQVTLHFSRLRVQEPQRLQPINPPLAFGISFGIRNPMRIVERVIRAVELRRR